MKDVLTVKLKLLGNIAILESTTKIYTNLYNIACNHGFNSNEKNQINLHNHFYKTFRNDLPSQLCISVLTKATETIKSALTWKKKNPNTKTPFSKQCSIRFDSRSSTFKLKENKVSLLTIEGRVIFDFKSRNLDKFQGYKTKSSELVKKENTWFLCLVFEKDISDFVPNQNKVIGIDRGINNPAVLSNGRFYKIDSSIKEKIIKVERLRRNLQSKGTKSARRHLKKLSSKIHCYGTEQNHIIAKNIVANNPDSILVLEDLQNRWKKKGRKLNKKVFSWNYKQLETFLIYKGISKNISVMFTDPRYTSQKCSKCGNTDKSNRNGSIFKCLSCKYEQNADLNASFNIRLNWLIGKSNQSGLCINKPIVLGLEEQTRSLVL